jgi:AcrR family transcriptional regulator
VVFVTSGVDAPIREIAAGAGVGIGTIYRHFPTRADLVVAVYRHQVGACAEAGPALLASAGSPLAALRQWVGLFVDFLVTKHGLANALRSDSSGFDGLHAYFLDRLVPVCAQLLAPQSTLAKSGSIRTPTNWCGASTTSASAVTATRAMTPPPGRTAPPGTTATAIILMFEISVAWTVAPLASRSFAAWPVPKELPAVQRDPAAWHGDLRPFRDRREDPGHGGHLSRCSTHRIHRQPASTGGLTQRVCAPASLQNRAHAT